MSRTSKALTTLTTLTILLSCALPTQAVPAGTYALADGWWGELFSGGGRGQSGNLLGGFSSTMDHPIDPYAPDPFGTLPLNLFDPNDVADHPIDPVMPEQWLGGLLELMTVELTGDHVDPQGNGRRVYRTTYGTGLLHLNRSIWDDDYNQDEGEYASATVAGEVVSTHYYTSGQLTGFNSALTLNGSFLNPGSDLTVTAQGTYAGTSETDPVYDLGHLTSVELTVHPNPVPDGGASVSLLCLALSGLVAARRLRRS